MAYGNSEVPAQRYGIDAGRLWASGIATALVADLATGARDRQG